ncbi:MAG: glycosyltransferase, partial [Bryobacteraceae bacterium]|nr:glycosyltransferase [Bryobacteraceae bacterium]
MLSTNLARGGAETLVAQLSIELQRRGHEIHVVSLVKPSAFESDLDRAGVRLHAPGLLFVPASLREIRPQILHCHMFHANVLGRLLRTILPFNAVISTLHSIAESGRNSRSVAVRDLLYRATDRLAEITASVSAAVGERHRQAGATRSECVVPNGIDTSAFYPDPEARLRLRAELRLGDDFVWIAVGRLIWKKNFAALIHACRELPEATLLLVGTGPEESALRALAGPNVRFLGHRSDVPALLNAAD